MKRKISIFPVYLLTFILTFSGFFSGFEKKVNAETTKPLLKSFKQSTDEKSAVKQFLSKSSNSLLKTQSVQTNAISSLPSIKLNFKPADTVIDPNKPIIYMTDIDNMRVYSVNYETGETKSLQFNLKPERITFANNEVYVTLLKVAHDRYNFDNQIGAIAVINSESFMLADQFDIAQDPYDIEVDNQGYIYISPGSGQRSDLVVYSRQTKQQISRYVNVGAEDLIQLQPNTSRLYLTTTCSPSDIEVYVYTNGIYQTYYDSPYHGDYDIRPYMQISPDGKYIFNSSGNIFACSDKRSDDMKYVNKLSSAFTDVAFNLNSNLIFAAQPKGNIKVYNYENFSELSTLITEGISKNLYYKNNQLLSVSSTANNTFILERINLNSNQQEPLEIIGTSLMNNAKNVPIKGTLAIEFNKNITLKNPNCTLLDSNNNPFPVSRYSAVNNILFIYYDNLPYGGNIKFTLNGDAVADYNLNMYGKSFQLNFTTGAEYTRLCGNSRYETSAKISQKYWLTSDYVVLATGEKFPDALCAGPLAAHYQAPILLTPSQSLDPTIELEITRLSPKQVFIIGGPGAVSDEIKGKLQSKGITVTRIYGASRYDTSLEIAKYLGANEEIVVATGNNYPDALSVASCAAYYEVPIILTDTNSLPANTAAYIRNTGVKYSYIIGGPGVVGDSVFKALPNCDRIYGSNRYDTNSAVLEYFSFNFATAYVSTGQNFADALAGSSPAGLMHSPIILVNDDMPQDVIDVINYNKALFRMKVILGGTGVVSDNILNRIFK